MYLGVKVKHSELYKNLIATVLFHMLYNGDIAINTNKEGLLKRYNRFNETKKTRSWKIWVYRQENR